MLRRLLDLLFGPRPAPTPVPPAPVPPPPNGGNLLGAINAERRAYLLPPLAPDARLTTAARDHAADLDRTGRLSHTGSDGSNFMQRAARHGFLSYPRGEVVAAGQRSDAEAVADWLASPGHRRILLDPLARSAGAHAAGAVRVALTA